jgi:HEPN domain-containing protein
VSDRDKPSLPERQAEAVRWLIVAAEDMRIAEACLALADPALGGAAYHCQQAAEKAIKGLLIVAAKSFRRTHDLEELGTLAAVCYPHASSLLAQLGPLTTWGVAYRYPGVDEFAEVPPGPTEVAAAITHIRDLLVLLNARVIPIPGDRDSSG